MMQQIMTFEAAYRGVLKRLMSKGFVTISVKPLNRNRYMIALSEDNAILVMYKRETFRTFGDMFKHKGMKGEGDSINADDLKMAMKEGVTKIYAVFPDGKVYSISMESFVAQALPWENLEGKYVFSIPMGAYAEEFQL